MNDDKTWTDPVVSNESFDIDTAGLAPGRYYVSIGVFGENASGPNPDTLIGSLGGILASNRLTNYRIAQLEKRVDKHNNLVERMAAAEDSIKSAHRRIDDITRRK